MQSNIHQVSIPQAVSTVATEALPAIVLDNRVSIPQAVSTVATDNNNEKFSPLDDPVSIPQAVSTVATI